MTLELIGDPVFSCEFTLRGRRHRLIVLELPEEPEPVIEQITEHPVEWPKI